MPNFYTKLFFLYYILLRNILKKETTLGLPNQEVIT